MPREYPEHYHHIDDSAKNQSIKERLGRAFKKISAGLRTGSLAYSTSTEKKKK